MTERPMPTEEGVLAFHKRCEDFYPADAVDADITQQRAWYDALCAAFDAPAPAGMVKEDGLVAERIPVRHYRPASVTTPPSACARRSPSSSVRGWARWPKTTAATSPWPLAARGGSTARYTCASS